MTDWINFCRMPLSIGGADGEAHDSALLSLSGVEGRARPGSAGASEDSTTRSLPNTPERQRTCLPGHQTVSCIDVGNESLPRRLAAQSGRWTRPAGYRLSIVAASACAFGSVEAVYRSDQAPAVVELSLEGFDAAFWMTRSKSSATEGW
jgi:hypothetical protein